MSLRIVAAAPRHRAGWGRLHAGYAAFYGAAQPEAMRETAWAWTLDPAQEVKALVAEAPDGEPLGLAHHRLVARPLRASRGLFLDGLSRTRRGGAGASRRRCLRRWLNWRRPRAATWCAG